MALTIAQFCALFVLNGVAAVFTGLVISAYWGVWGGIKPLVRRLDDIESETEALKKRFSTHQKRVAGETSAQKRETAVPLEIQALMAGKRAQAGNRPDMEYVG